MNHPLQKNTKQKKSDQMNTKKGGNVIKVAGLLVVVLTFLAAIFYGQLAAVNPNAKNEKEFAAKHGSSPLQIANNLEKEGLIKNARVFLVYAQLTKKISKLKAGDYLLSPSLTVPQIVDKLVEGKMIKITFTIPEGYNLHQIAEVLINKGITNEQDFWETVKNGKFNYSFLNNLPNTDKRLEGYLFPDTYVVTKGMPVESVINMMLKRFNDIYSKLPENKSGLSEHEVVTLASIVEGECVLDKERQIVASVFFNRLKIGMKLDSDATVQYLFDKRKERVYYKDLEMDSPYNTYRNKGLPPGPIGSPGEASLRAVLEPADTKYFYFVARKDNSGEHVFAKNLKEHNKNKRLLGY